MEFLLIVFLTLLNGVFAMSELALAGSKRARLGALAEAGNQGAKAALELLGNPNQFLSTVQVGITSIGVLNGIVGEAAFSDGVAAWLQAWGTSEKASAITATALVVTAITFTTIIFGELVPKRIGQLYPESVACWVARPMLWLAKAAKPFVKLLSSTTAGTLKLLRIDANASRAVTEEEISASLEEGVDAGLIEEHEHQMVQNVFRLDERPLTSLMTPRTDVQWLDSAGTVGHSLALAATGGGRGAHSWYPVCRGSLDDVVGIVSVAQLLDLRERPDEPLSAHASPAVFVPETLSGMELLEQFRLQSGRLVFVVDEYGVVQGLLTPRDLLEAITGELQVGAQADAWATEREDGSWLLDGVMPLGELKSRLDMDGLPGEERGRYNTLAGLLMSITGRLPRVGERISCQNWTFEVVDLDGRRVDKVLAVQHRATDEPV
ncbi:MAG: hemolysin family protein [Rhodoferax sp.]|nr:hemolysin family protein [Rhodoferax sp.]